MKIRDATHLIGLLERGDLAAALNEKLREVVVACQDAAGPKREVKGKLTLELNVAVEGQKIAIEADIKTKVPKTQRPRSFYFVTATGDIDTDHPQQIDMFPRDARERERDNG